MMHELSIAVELIQTVEDAARQANAARVSRVSIDLGALSGVEADALQFAYDVATARTLLEGSILDITAVPIQVTCSACGTVTTLPIHVPLVCGACGRSAVPVTQGKELLISCVEVLDETEIA
jgi:hydrogenase nickel incorporation protein HypA/HybF